LGKTKPENGAVIHKQGLPRTGTVIKSYNAKAILKRSHKLASGFRKYLLLAESTWLWILVKSSLSSGVTHISDAPYVSGMAKFSGAHSFHLVNL
jgi:hypothetical protein